MSSSADQDPPRPSGDRDSASSSGHGCPYPGVCRLNDAVYEVHRPKVPPRAEIVFFHGIQERDYGRAYYETWLTRDNKCWPQEWLPEFFDTAAIYLVSYDSSATEDSTHGRYDIFSLGEYLLVNLINANIGQRRRCPLILVGHDLGGLVIKEVCVQADESHRTTRKAFLNQVSGIFFFSTPHGGVDVTDELKDESELMAGLRRHHKTTARLNEKFRKLRNFRKWKASGIHASHNLKKGQLNYSGEAAGRHDVDEFLLIPVDSDEICKPVDKSSSSFQCLEKFVSKVLSGFVTNRPELPFVADPVYVPLVDTMRKVCESLRSSKIHVTVLSGEAGSGKTSLAKHLALEYLKQPGQAAEFWDGVYFVECGRAADVVTIQRILLGQLGLKTSLKGVPSELKGRDSDFNRLLRQHLQHQEALIILDDVCDYSLMKALVVHGAKLRYLLTSQESKLWTASDTRVCLIENVQLDCGMQIIAKQVGFPDARIPNHLERVVTDLVKTVHGHPLALATLAMTVHTERKSMLKEWIEVNRHLDTYLDQDQERNRPVGFGDKYPTGVYASMMYAMKLLYMESPDAFEILCFIALFKGPSVPIRLIQLFAMWIHPKHRNHVYMWIKELEGRTLLQLHNVQAGRSGDMSVTMHGLRQRFILATGEGYVEAMRDQVWSFAGATSGGGKSEYNMAIALCALYGVGETRKHAERVLGSMMRNLPLVTKQDSKDFLFQLIRLMDDGKDLEHDIVTEAAEEVLWSYVSTSQLDTESITCLLSQVSAEAFRTTSIMFVNLFLHSAPEKSCNFSILAFAWAFESLVQLALRHERLPEALQLLRALLGSITSGHRIRFQDKGTVPIIARGLDRESLYGPLDTNLESKLIIHPTSPDTILTSIACTQEGDTHHIMMLPNALHGLLGALDKENPTELRLQALALLSFVTLTDTSVLEEIVATPAALDSIALSFQAVSDVQPQQNMMLGVLDYLAIRTMRSLIRPDDRYRSQIVDLFQEARTAGGRKGLGFRGRVLYFAKRLMGLVELSLVAMLLYYMCLLPRRLQKVLVFEACGCVPLWLFDCVLRTRRHYRMVYGVHRMYMEYKSSSRILRFLYYSTVLYPLLYSLYPDPAILYLFLILNYFCFPYVLFASSSRASRSLDQPTILLILIWLISFLNIGNLVYIIYSFIRIPNVYDVFRVF